MSKSTFELAEKICLGDKLSFTDAFTSFYPGLCYYAEKLVHDRDESHSMVQQVFVDLWVKREKLIIEQSLKAYLHTAVRNHALDYLKHKAVETKYLKESQPFDSMNDHNLIEEAELNSRINAEIENLPKKCREIFILCRYNDLQYSEIAIKLGISVKTVEMQMGIALKKLRFRLSDLLEQKK
jgi:RNA polymerase sigma-70 factor (ECF subfamily)